MRALIIEDDYMIATDLRKILQDQGIEVVGLANDLDSAFELGMSELPDVVIVDLSLKGIIDGLTIAEELKNRIACEVVFATAYSSRVVQSARRIDADVFAKPYRPGEIVEAVRERGLLARRQKAQAAAIAEGG